MSTNSNSPDHLPDLEKPGYIRHAMAGIPLLATLMLAVGLYQLGIADGGVLGLAKIAVISIAAFIVSYTLYRLAIEKGATLSSRGYKSATALSGMTTLLVGLVFFLTTTVGLIIQACEELRLQDHQTELVKYVDDRSASAAQTTRAIPVVAAIQSDLGSKAQCEIQSSCVSSKGSGGYGSTARMLQTLESRAATISDAASEGLTNRDAVRTALDDHIIKMDEILADEGTSIWSRRVALRKADGELGGLLNELDEAVPVSLMAAYAGELRSGVSMPQSPDVGETINGILRGYASNLDAVGLDVQKTSAERPEFPARTGALQTFGYAADFAPIVLLAFLIDLVLPLSLWAYTLMGLDWLAFQRNPSRKKAQRDRSDFDDLTELQVLDVPKRVNGHAEPRSSHRTSSTHRKNN
ncbi:hypothetical protein [Sulfitobacter geojensis]|uniref:hypothetical protein n=1 Tax=Sulfitobacter geojensis TaxID=1342299 RepID=UPI0036DE7142